MPVVQCSWQTVLEGLCVYAVWSEASLSNCMMVHLSIAEQFPALMSLSLRLINISQNIYTIPVYCYMSDADPDETTRLVWINTGHKVPIKVGFSWRTLRYCTQPCMVILWLTELFLIYLQAVVDVVVNLQFSLIEALWQGFWRNQSLDQRWVYRWSLNLGFQKHFQVSSMYVLEVWCIEGKLLVWKAFHGHQYCNGVLIWLAIRNLCIHYKVLSVPSGCQWP